MDDSRKSGWCNTQLRIIMNYTGTIIQESLDNPHVLAQIKIINTTVEEVTLAHKTPWLNIWTLHTVEIPEVDADRVASVLSRHLDSRHPSAWYIDFKNSAFHYIIFPNKIFKIDYKTQSYSKAIAYGIQVGIPRHQLDFSH